MKKLYDEEGFWRHCEVAEAMFQLGIDPHTRHHINSAIRQASNKVHNGKTKDTKRGAHHMSESARDRVRAGSCDNLVVDHVVPVSVLTEMIFDLPNKTREAIGSSIRDWTLLALITVEEHQALRHNKMYARMPDRWSTKDSKTARYDKLEIRLVDNEYDALC